MLYLQAFERLARMPFTAHDLRYKAEQSYPLLYAYLHRNAQRFLGSLRYDAFEVDLVIGHVVEQLVRLGLFNGRDHTPQNALDRLTDAQFYTFLSRCVRNKAIDRLRKRRIQMSTHAELMAPDPEREDPLDEAVESVWGELPFATPEEIALQLASQLELRDLLKHCILALSAAPHQLQAVLQELEEMGAADLLHGVLEEVRAVLPAQDAGAHFSQHKDHAHKKLRRCLQQKSTNLVVVLALRLTEYGTRSQEANVYMVSVQTLAQDGLSEHDVRTGLNELAADGFLDWLDADHVRLNEAQKKRLSRFYREE
jgi:DNA-directed RNA polymerase specialized sigma24 family protein